jgi:hypothetical protein
VKQGVSPYPQANSPLKSWWYGQDSTGTYDNGAQNSGDLTSPPISIPDAGYVLHFWYWYETEDTLTTFDKKIVQISVNGGAFTDLYQVSGDPMSAWVHSPAINLAAYNGSTIQVRFHFDTADEFENAYRGWYVDDVFISRANDDFDFPVVVSAEPYTTTQNTSGVTEFFDDPTLPCVGWAGNNTVWYRYTPVSNATVVIDTLGSSYDTVLGVWTGTRGSLQNRACNDDYGDVSSRVEVSVVAGTNYYIEIAGFGPISEGSLTLNILKLPGAFNKSAPVNGAAGVSTTPTLTWAASSGATGYEYCYDTTDDGACTNWISTGTSTSASPSLSASTTYFWQVRANNGNGSTYANGSAAAYWSFTTAASLPGAFNKSAPANGAAGVSITPTLTWTASTGAAGYEYCYDTTNDNACSTWTSTGTSTSAGPSLSAGTTYYWQVRANNGGGTTYANGSPTAYWSFSTLANPPAAFNKSIPANGATGVATNQALNWAASTGATSYEYCIDTTNDTACTTWVNTGTATTASPTLANGTNYYWHVRATNAGGTTYSNGSASAFWSFTTIISAPGAFNKSAPVNTATGIPINQALSWGTSSGAASYEYCIDTTNDNACTTWTSTGTSTSASPTLINGTTYYWQVRAINAGGTTYANGSATAFWSFTTIISAPGAFNKSAPANTATGVPTNQALSWGTSSGATSYEYCIDTTNDNACTTWTSTGTSTSAGPSLSDGTTYYWQVRASNAGGTTYANGSAATYWVFTTIAAPPGAFNKSAPANAAVGVSITPTLSWGVSTGATSYEYCYDTTNDNACTTWTSTGTSTSASPSLSASTTYYWQVRANNSGGTIYANGSAADYWSFTTVANPPGAFNKSAPTNGAVGVSITPTLTWAASTGATGYEYCYDTSNDNACATWTSTGMSTSASQSLSAGTTYYWQVRASNSGGTTYANGSAAAYWVFATVVTPPGEFNKSAPANGAPNVSLNPTLSWGASSGATSYEYCYDTTNDDDCSNWTNVGALTSASPSGLSTGTQYYWQVRATNAAGTVYADGYWFIFTTTNNPYSYIYLPIIVK